MKIIIYIIINKIRKDITLYLPMLLTYILLLVINIFYSGLSEIMIINIYVLIVIPIIIYITAIPLYRQLIKNINTWEKGDILCCKTYNKSGTHTHIEGIYQGIENNKIKISIDNKIKLINFYECDVTNNYESLWYNREKRMFKRFGYQ